MQKIINFRAFLFIFIGAILGVFFVFQTIQKNLLFINIFVAIILGLLIFVLITGFILKVKKFEFLNKFLLCLFIGIFTFFCLGTVSYQFFNKNLEDVNSCEVSARVENLSESSGSYYLILENATIKNLENNKSFKVNGKISVLIYSDDYAESFKIGDNISFKGTLVSSNIIKKGKFNSYLYKNNIKYSAFISKTDYIKTNGDMHIDEKVKNKVKTILFENLSYSNASIAYASIFGDKTMMQEDAVTIFSNSGTAHLLCVSGLHVGFLVATLYLIFNLLKIKKKHIFIILSIFLIFYCYLCGFASSVVRASIMSIVLAGSNCFGNYRYDNLNSLGFAGVIILLFKPFMIFDIGFQLSFASCFGIFLLMPVFEKFFKKINFYNKFSQAFCLTLSAQIGTFPIIFHNFESMSFLSVIANIIVVPLFSIVFNLLFIFVLLNLILPLGFLFKVVEIGLNFTIILTKSFGSATFEIYYSNQSEIVTDIAFYMCLVFASGLINIKNKTKLLNMLICVLIISFSFLSGFIPRNYNFSSIINTSNNDFTIITNSFNQKVLVVNNKADLEDYKTLKKDLFNYKIFKLDAIILSFYSSSSQDFVVSVCNDYSVNSFYVSSLEDLEEKYLFNKLKNTSIYKTEDNFVSLNTFTFKIIENIKSVEISLIDKDVTYRLFLASSLNKGVNMYILNYNLTGDLFKAKYINNNFTECLSGYKNILSNNYVNAQNVYSLSKISDILKLGEVIK